jgi:hypothetical protein
MRRSSSLVGLIAIAVMLSGFAGGGRVANAPPVVPYVCDGGRTASAIYQHGGVFIQARLRLTIDGRTSEMMAAPTLYGSRYLGEPSAGEPRRLIWSLRGEQAWLAEATEPYRSDGEGRRLLTCHRQRGAGEAHGPAEH